MSERAGGVDVGEATTEFTPIRDIPTSLPGRRSDGEKKMKAEYERGIFQAGGHYPILITNTGLSADEVAMRDPLVEIWERWLKSKGLSHAQFIKETFLADEDVRRILRKVFLPHADRSYKPSSENVKRAKQAKAWLEKKNLSVDTFARRLRVSYGTAVRWFYDKYPRAPRRTMKALIKDIYPDCPLAQ